MTLGPTVEPEPSDGYEVVDHTADWALRVHGADLAELLQNAARGMTALMVDAPGPLPQDVERSLELDALDAETLLVDWLSELAYWAESEMLVFSWFEFAEVSSTHLEVVVRGGRAQELAKHIKAVTYHDLQIEETAQGLSATVVFDV